ncbi:hypothetical protein MRB53_037126 [Persea americana]|nr:hypothetical protein MRB53_037126 [Persea americana]
MASTDRRPGLAEDQGQLLQPATGGEGEQSSRSTASGNQRLTPADQRPLRASRSTLHPFLCLCLCLCPHSHASEHADRRNYNEPDALSTRTRASTSTSTSSDRAALLFHPDQRSSIDHGACSAGRPGPSSCSEARHPNVLVLVDGHGSYGY